MKRAILAFVLGGLVTAAAAAADTVNPTIGSLSPANGTADVPGGVAIAAAVADDVEVNAASVVFTVNGQTVPGSYDAEAGIASCQPTTALANGTASVSLSVADTTGNLANAAWSFTVANVFIVHGEATEGAAVSIGAGDVTVTGNVYAAADVELSGANCSVSGVVQAVGTVASQAGATGAVQNGVDPQAFISTTADDVASRATVNHQGPLYVTAANPLAAGIHNVAGDVRIVEPLTANVTIVASGRIIIESDDVHLTAKDQSDVVLFGGQGVEIKGPNSSFVGCIVAPTDTVSVSGASVSVTGNGRPAGIWGNTVSITGSEASLGD